MTKPKDGKTTQDDPQRENIPYYTKMEPNRGPQTSEGDEIFPGTKGNEGPVGNQDFKVREKRPQDADELEGNWSELKIRAQQKWGQLTDDDLAAVNGRRDALIGVLQSRYGYDRMRALEEVKHFLHES